MSPCESHEDPFIFTLVLKPVLSVVKEARDLVAFAWAHWELGDDYAARVVVSELVTNAVRVSAEGQHVVVRTFLRDGGTPVIECWDESPESVVMRSTSLTDSNGRGLFIIDQLCEDWQVHPTTEGGKVVRVEMGRRV